MSIKFKKLLSTFLAITTIFTTVCAGNLGFSTIEVQAAAGVSGDGNTGGGNSSMHSSSDYKAWYNEVQGYRMYIVGTDGKLASGIIDFYYKLTGDTNLSLTTFSTRFGTTADVDIESFNKLSAWTGSGTPANKIPQPTVLVNGSRVGNGEAFRKWMLQNSDGSMINGGAITGSYASSGSGSASIGAGNHANTGTSPASQLQYYSSAMQYYTEYVTNGKAEMLVSDLGQAVRGGGSKANAAKRAYDVINSVEVKKVLNDSFQSYMSQATKAGLNSSDSVKYALGRLYKTYSGEQMQIGPGGGYINYGAAMVYLDTKSSLSLSSKDINFSILDMKIPLANNTGTSGKGSYNMDTPIDNIINDMVERATEKIEGVDSNMQTQTTSAPVIQLLRNAGVFIVDGYKSAYEAVATGKYILIVEPCTALYVPLGNNVYKPKGNREWGSYYELCEKWYGDTKGNYYASLMSSLLPNGLRVDKDMAFESELGTLTITASPNATWTTKKALQAMQAMQGTSMQIYSSFSSGGSSTSTYDEPLGDTPGPAPDDSSLIQKGDETDDTKIAKIVKFYETIKEDGTVERDDSFTRRPTPTTIQVEDEPTYKVVDWYTSDVFKEASGTDPDYNRYKSSMSNKQTGTSTGQVQITTPETTLYVKLQRKEKQANAGSYNLTQSKLTRNALMSNTDKGTDLLKSHVFGVTFNDDLSYSGHCYSYEESCSKHGSHTRWVNHGNGSLTDDTITVKIQNSTLGSNAELISALTTSGWKNRFENSDAIQATRPAFSVCSTDVSGFDYKFVIHRAQKDKTQLYNGILSASDPAYGKANDAGLTGVGFTTGVNTTARRNGSVNYALSMTFAKDDNSDYHTQGDCSDGRHSDHSGSNVTVQEYTSTTDVTIQTYAGKAKTELPCESGEFKYGLSGYDKVSGTKVAGKTFSVIPYIKMQYQTMDSGFTPAYVTGTHIRTFTMADYGEIAWKKYSGFGLNVTSNQWSTHKTAYEKIGQWNKVLPGGAIFSLDTKNKNQKLLVNSYQVILEGNGLAQVQQYDSTSTNAMSRAQAEQTHEEFVQATIDGINGVQLELWVNKNKDEEQAWKGDKAVKISANADIKKLGNGSANASSDSKYFLQNETAMPSSANAGNLNAAVKKATTYHTYTFYTDTNGDMYMSEDNVNGKGTKILTKQQDSSNLTNNRAQMINQRTSVVDQLCASLERNTGADTSASWASDGKWYNEAFSGVTVLVASTELEVGLLQSSVRSTIMDPKLIPQSTSKGGSFTNFHSFQLRTSNSSLNYGDEDQISVFNGAEVYMDGMNEFFISDKFYIPDMTVQDLS